MFRRLFFIFQLVIFAGLFSCRTYKPVVLSSGSDLSAEDYINEYKDLAVSEMKRTGIPASITLAQGMIESDFGRSTIAREGNNHFGIKCHDDWTGPIIRHHDDKRNECFRKYSKPESSFYDHSDFLKSGSRYTFLFDLEPTNYKAWARGLKKAGYATNPDYANMLINTIEEYNLWNFDRGYQVTNLTSQTKVPVKESFAIQDTELIKKPVNPANGNNSVAARVPRIMENNRIQYIIVKEGDTKEKLEKEFQLLKWELSKYNELNSDFQLVPGQILYLQPKRERAEPGKEYHITEAGDTFYLISQRYGIKLKKLYEMNRMDEGTEPESGKKIWLRSIKPVN
ncbi:MAG: LysM peptidoglycan-binding domain-containing protein [Bacteroidetes bacterium]|nr:MAG: LysM peptidoglycan-binding domain-containing protein [Bacteroidota bacterium]